MSDIPSDVESSYKKSTSKCVPEGATNDQFTHVESSGIPHEPKCLGSLLYPNFNS